MGRYHKSVLTFFILLLHLEVPSLQAQWVEDGVEICTAWEYQEKPQITTDGARGSIITWKDPRTGSFNIFAQRVDSSGNIQWTIDGVPICMPPGNAEEPRIVSDGVGGAIIAWRDWRNSTLDIFAQRIDASGNVQWTVDGVAICTAIDAQLNPQITSDGTGGAIIIWRDSRSGTDNDIYAQRIDASGNIQWIADGVAICTATSHQQYPEITFDGAGGAIIIWHDSRSGTDYDYDIYAQRINASGIVQWATDGVAISTAASAQYYAQITSDSAGGAIIGWEDYRNGTDTNIYTQRIDTDGSVLWTTDGVVVCGATNEQWEAQITSDGNGGAIIIWGDRRDGRRFHPYSQRIDSSGNVQWTADGVAICTEAMNDQHQSEIRIISDGVGGAIIAWFDYRTEDADIFAQRIDTDGNIMWTADGESICTATADQWYPMLISDDVGGAIITWEDDRNGILSDIYAMRVDRNGNSPPTNTHEIPSASYLAQNFPNPFNPSTKIVFGINEPAHVSLRIYNTSGRLIQVLIERKMDAGRHEIDWDGRSLNSRKVASGLYFYRIVAGNFTETKKTILIK